MSDRIGMDEERREAARIRRRWITLGEVLAVIGVLISALALWNSYAERRGNEAERNAEKAEKGAVSKVLVLKASGGGKSLTLDPRDPEQNIRSQTILFPSPLETKVDELVQPRIESDWVKQAVKKAHDLGRKEPKGPGDARMPVAITTRFDNGGGTFTDTAIYDVGYKESGGGLFGGTNVALRGLSLVERVSPARAQARLDAIWAGRGR
ncbi:MAG TPA: hypothetical protein VH331_05620 [Allosphingosinicella sp.]|jgi:hypothetical protein|nr:hypothetical protein [Allosphingosinicella sp.]